jgi:hypothetical protein
VNDVHDLDDILVYQSDGSYAGSLVKRGEGPSEVGKPRGLAVDAADSLWISDGRRRIVLTQPDGTPARTVAGFSGVVHGFTESGLPFEPLIKGVEVDSAIPFVRFWSRTGDSIASLGPGASARWASGRSVPIQKPSLWAASMELVWSGLRSSPDVLVEEWTPAGVRPLVTIDQLRAAVGDAIASMERVWTTGVIGLSSKQFAVLVRLGEPARVTGRGALPDSIDDLGVLFNANADGSIRGAILVPGAPVSFVDRDHYFTFRDDESGLVRLTIWRIERTCRP